MFPILPSIVYPTTQAAEEWAYKAIVCRLAGYASAEAAAILRPRFDVMVPNWNPPDGGLRLMTSFQFERTESQLQVVYMRGVVGVNVDQQALLWSAQWDPSYGKVVLSKTSRWNQEVLHQTFLRVLERTVNPEQLTDNGAARARGSNDPQGTDY